MPYSPSQTEMYARCPLLWWLQRRQGYTTKYIAKNELAKWMGTSIHAGMSEYYINNRTPSADVLLQTIRGAWQSQVDEALSQGRVIDNEEVRLEVEGKLTLAPKLLIGQDPFPLSYKIVHVEGILEDNSRIDLGGYTNAGIPFYADFKTTLYCLEKDISSRLGDYAFSHQMLHYAWFYSKALGEPIRRYIIPYMIMGPKPMIHPQPFEVEPQQLDRWYVSAQQWWGEMDMWLGLAKEKGPDWVTAHIKQSPNHKDGWGRCAMYSACVDFNLDPELMKTQYIQIEKGVKV